MVPKLLPGSFGCPVAFVNRLAYRVAECYVDAFDEDDQMTLDIYHPSFIVGKGYLCVRNGGIDWRGQMWRKACGIIHRALASGAMKGYDENVLSSHREAPAFAPGFSFKNHSMRGKMRSAEVSDAVKNLRVEKSEFDAAMKKLIATPPIRAPKPAAKRHRAKRHDATSATLDEK